MSTVKKKIIILSAVFIAALLIGMTQAPVQKPAAEEGSTLSAASLPVLCLDWEGSMIDPLRAYTKEMDPACFTDSVYPLTEENMTISGALYDSAGPPAAISYEVRDEADGRLIERGSARFLSVGSKEYRFGLSLQDLYEAGTYYRLKFTVDLGNELQGSYYTRIKIVDEETLTALMDYAAMFHDALFDKTAASGYYPKLEPNDEADRKTLAYVDIHCSPDQVSWGSSGAKPASRSWMTIQSLEGDLGHFRFDYLASADFGGLAPITLRCAETMTLRKNRDSMYLLKYERHANQLWEAGEDTVSTKGFLLGVQEEALVRTVSRGNVTAFAVNGELYCYDTKAGRLTRVFSFRRRGEHELRTLCGDCRIEIMNVDESGNIDFVVSGYQNGGSREGLSAAVWYSYHAETAELQENITLDSNRPPRFVQEDAARLFRLAGDNYLYLCLDRKIAVVDISTGETAVLVDSAAFDSLVQSKKGTAFAWQSGSDLNFPTSIRVMDLEKGINQSITAEEGEFIRVLGYMREDLIIGRGRKSDKPLDDGEGGRYPLYALEILNEDLETITTYGFPEYLISGIETDDERIIVHRYGQTKTGGYYIYADDDVLLRSDSETTAPSGGATTYQHETLMRVSMIPMSKLPSYLRLEMAGNLLIREGRMLSLPAAGNLQAHYFAYGRGRLLGTYQSAGEAILAASPEYGYVTDASDGRLLWTWTSKRSKRELSPGDIRSDLAKHLDLSGASYRSLLYYIDRGMPVRWISPDRGEVWLIGYKGDECTVYDPQARNSYILMQDEIEEAIVRNDNYLWCYMD